jgi:glycosyltransferase involved in cell wall biosynthesis
MRIVYIHQYYCNLQMWGGTRSYELARRLVAQGHEVHVLTTDIGAERGGYRWRHTRDDGIDVHWFPVPYSNKMSYARRIRAFGEFAAVSTVKAASIRADLVLATSTPLTVAIPGVLAAKLRRTPFVFEVRDLWPEVPIQLGALRSPLARAVAGALATFAYRNAEHVIALSPGMAAGVNARYPPVPTTVIPNASDIELFAGHEDAAARLRAEHDWLGDRPLVVYTGALGAVNGLDYLVRLAAKARTRDPEIRFLIVGQGKEWEQTHRLAAELGVLDTTLHMWPSVPKAQLPAILGAATMSTSMCRPVPALWENSANKFFDALAAGRPIAINYGGWQRDLLRESGAGLVLDPADVDSAADAVVEHVRDEAWLHRARAAAHRLAVEKFSRDLLFDRFQAVLADAAATGRGRRRREPAAGGATTSGKLLPQTGAETTTSGKL